MQGLLLWALQHSASCLQLGLCSGVASPQDFYSSTLSDCLLSSVSQIQTCVPSFVEEHS